MSATHSTTSEPPQHEGLDVTATADEHDKGADFDGAPNAPHLFLVIECDRPLAGGTRHALSGVRELILGRGERRSITREPLGSGARLTLLLPARTLSGVHLRLCNQHGHWTLEDTDSTNGTHVNGVRVTRAILQDGDVIEAGRCFFRFREAMPTPGDLELDVDGETFDTEPGLATLLPAESQRLSVLAELARTRLPVLLLGESGTGKELLARAVHSRSGRTGAFIAVNCGAIPSSLLESQLFGHVKGAFSGAVREELGFVRAADSGTLFLDEIAEMPLTSQVALLRVLQESQVTPIGASQAKNVDTRVVAATHRALHQLASTGAFRLDLLARLDGHTHVLLPLRERKEDLGVLVRDILRKNQGGDNVRLTPDAVRDLLGRSFSLNIRGLEHTLIRGVALARAQDGLIRANQLRASMPSMPVAMAASEPRASPSAKRLSPADEQLRGELQAQLIAHRGNVAEVGRAMGKARMQIHRWVKRFGLDVTAFRTTK